MLGMGTNSEKVVLTAFPFLFRPLDFFVGQSGNMIQFIFVDAPTIGESLRLQEHFVFLFFHAKEMAEATRVSWFSCQPVPPWCLTLECIKVHNERVTNNQIIRFHR